MKRVIKCDKDRVSNQLVSPSMKQGYDAAVKMLKSHRKLMEALKDK